MVDLAANAPRSRSRGRPRATPDAPDAAVGRDMLVEATVAMLKTHPPATITPVVVARSIGVHPSLIRYYFRNRASLLIAVAEQLTRQFAAQVEMSAHADESPRSRLCARIGALIDLNATYPFFHQLFASEIANSDDPAARAMIAQFADRGTGAYGAILRAGSIDGSLRGVDPVLLYVAVVGMAEFFAAGRRQLEIAHGTPLDEEALRTAYKAFVCDLVLNGVGRHPG